MTNKNKEAEGKKIFKIFRIFKRRRDEAEEKETKRGIIGKDLTEEEIKKIRIRAYVLSRKYKYHKLMMAADYETAKVEGREVHGYLYRMFPDEYDWLIENDVLDLACHFAMREFAPEIFTLIENYDFDHAIINVVSLAKRDNFDIYPEFEFEKVIILTQGEPFKSAVHWIENVEWETDDGYNTTVTLAPSNYLNTGFSLWDLPVLVLKDAVGKDKIFFEAKTTAQELVRVHDQVLKTHIYKKRQEEKTMKEKLEESEIKYEQLEERHQYLKDEILTGDTRNAEEKLRDFERRFDKKYQPLRPKYKKMFRALIIITCIFMIIVCCIVLFSPQPQVPIEVPNEAGILIDTLFQRGI